MSQISHLKGMEDAILKAGRYLARDYGEVENLQVSRKGAQGFVTSADLKAEKIVVEELQRSFPDYSIVSEEAGIIKGSNSQYTFILDPIDGTTNFMHGLPFFCTSLALQENLPDSGKKIVAAAIYSPILDEMYLAEKNEGSRINGKRLKVSGRNKLEEAVFSAYLAKFDLDQRSLDLEALNCAKIHTRIYGSAALELCFIAAGKLEGMWHWKLKPWDIAAGSLIVQEAGGIVTEIDGGLNFLNSGCIIAANSELHEKLRKKIESCYSKKPA